MKLWFFILSFITIISFIFFSVFVRKPKERDLYYTLSWPNTIEKMITVREFSLENDLKICRLEDFKVRTANPLLERDRDWVGGRCIVALFSSTYTVGEIQGTCLFELLVKVSVETNPGRLMLFSPYVDKITYQGGDGLPMNVENLFKKEIETSWQGDVLLGDLTPMDDKMLLSGACELRKEGLILRLGR